MADIGNSNRIARAYLDSLMIETRYMDSETPVVDYKLYGMKAASPIMTAALSHLDRFCFPAPQTRWRKAPGRQEPYSGTAWRKKRRLNAWPATVRR